MYRFEYRVPKNSKRRGIRRPSMINAVINAKK